MLPTIEAVARKADHPPDEGHHEFLVAPWVAHEEYQHAL
jgi:hypothetical protein